ncbi:UbiA family prenyltransferase [Streptomyces sp. NPDC016845]|uniref:UbiA family prenyltransferase n=1 Tax=Streptomyces sp. NPDC016845 TaxID=3364972 RepID=UPI0037B1A6E8
MVGRWERVRAHAETLRLYDLVVVALVGGLGATLAAPVPQVRDVVLAMVSGLSGCAGALYAADYLTRADDVVDKPYRPIPSGRLTASAAKWAAALLTSGTLVLDAVVAWHSLVFVVLAGVSYAAYGAGLKGRGLWGDAASGFAGWTCPLLAGACFSSAWPQLALLLPALALGLQGTFSNVLLAIHDVDQDRRAGSRTLPVRRGVRTSVRVLGALAATSYLAAVSTPLVLGRPAPPVFWVLLLGAAVTAGVVVAGARTATGKSVARHLCERVLLPGALWTSAEPLAGGALVVAALSVVVSAPRPMLRPGTAGERSRVGRDGAGA